MNLLSLQLLFLSSKGTVLDLSKDPIKKLAAGSMHSVALTHSGNVYVWGSNKEGQLGLGDEAEETSYSAENLCFEKDTIKDISCGYYHTAIVTESGDLYTFGEADGGKLGLGDIVNNNQDTIDEPTKVEIPEKVGRSKIISYA
jgi:X-linked retinitis pigmentosa GTPase regulator